MSLREDSALNGSGTPLDIFRIPPAPEGSRRGSIYWLAWIILPLFTAAGCVGHGGIVSLGFTPLAIIVGFYFLLTSPRDFMRFNVLLFVFTPFIRRLADLTGTYSVGNPIILAPYLVTAMVVFKVFRQRPSRQTLLMFGLPALALLYGLAVGIISVREASVIKSLVRWTMPLLFGIYCVQNDDKEGLRKTFLQTALYCSAIAGVYALFQYVFAPVWDANWITNVQSSGAGGGGLSFGTPVPFGIRVFSTMNSPGNYASFCCIGILCALFQQTWWKYPNLLVNALALLSTRVRTSWAITVVLVIVLVIRMPSAQRRQILTALGVMLLAAAVILTPYLNTNSGAAMVERLTSFGSVGEDASYKARSAGIATAFSHVITQPFGEGIGYMESAAFSRTTMATVDGVGAHDIAALEIPYELGYLGMVLYMWGVTLATVMLAKVFFRTSDDRALLALIAVDVWLFLPGTNPFINYDGFIFWMAVGLLTGVGVAQFPAKVSGQAELRGAAA